MKKIRLIWFCWLVLTRLPVQAASPLPVLPYPQQVTAGKAAVGLSFSLQLTGATAAIRERLSENWQLLAKEEPSSRIMQVLTLALDSSTGAMHDRLQRCSPGWQEKTGEEGYLLVLNKKGNLLAARTETGLFYGLQTLKQLTRAGWNHELAITDWPSFASRGVYDDISRGPIPTVATIKKQIERLAELKINSLSFYIEHVVQPPSYPDFAPANGKLTMTDIRELSDYAARFHMELVGSFQSFGHLNHILSLPRYASMGETSTMISPLDPKARQFLESVITDLCKVFSSPYFNVNCDETFDLGKGRSKAYVDSVGVARYYADHIKFLYDVLKKNGKQLMMWGDIALQHEEILDLLPKDIIYLTWEYGDQQSFDAWIKPFVKRGLRFVVCPGVVNSNRLFPDLQMAKANINGLLEAGKRDGALGALTTVWDDGGMCFFDSDWYGIYAAAEKGWNTGRTGTATFNQRYGQTAYGTQNGAYVKALSKLMELRSLPLTYNLTDQLWTGKILPDSGKKLLMNNSAVPQVLALVNAALRELDGARPLRNRADAAFLGFTLQQIKLVMESRSALASLTTNTGNAEQAISVLKTLASRYKSLRTQYTRFWNSENQPYWLGENLKEYNGKIQGLQKLEQSYQTALTHRRNPVPPALKISNADYFGYWLLAGPFNTKSIPSFLYSQDAAANVPPKPGDMAQYKGKTYRWKKWASQDGGIIDLQTYYGSTDSAVAYAYCSLGSGTDRQISALVEATGAQLFLNGSAVAAGKINSEGETPFLLSLKKGANHLVLKLPRTGDWQFTFRLDTSEPVTNHKQKYALNDKNSLHDADN